MDCLLNILWHELVNFLCLEWNYTFYINTCLPFKLLTCVYHFSFIYFTSMSLSPYCRRCIAPVLLMLKRRVRSTQATITDKLVYDNLNFERVRNASIFWYNDAVVFRRVLIFVWSFYFICFWNEQFLSLSLLYSRLICFGT